MPDRPHVYYDDLVTALATVGIDIGPDSGVRDVRMGPEGITTVRMVRSESGKGWQAHDDRVLLVEDRYELRHGQPCTCQWLDTSLSTDGYTSSRPGRPDPSCPQHGGAA